jgi:hypothetical protein
MLTCFNSEQVDSMLEAVLRIQIWDPVPSIPKDPIESLIIIFWGRKFYNSFGMDKNQYKVWISE